MVSVISSDIKQINKWLNYFEIKAQDNSLYVKREWYSLLETAIGIGCELLLLHISIVPSSYYFPFYTCNPWD